MTKYREKMVDEMIMAFGFEDERTIEFARLCETWESNSEKDKMLEAILASNKNFS